MSDKSRFGRPKKSEGPRFPRDEVDRLLVRGEEVQGEEGGAERRFPSIREIARRYGVAPSLIAGYAKAHDCKNRRLAFLAEQREQAVLHEPAPAEPAPAERTRRYKGRLKGVDMPRIPYEELDRLLVFGEVQELPDGGTTVVYPGVVELSRRYGCTNSHISKYAKKHNCWRRREEAQARIAVKVDQKLIERRADALAVSKDDAIRMIDNYLVNFERALAEGRVRFDNPVDFNTMLRLKEFVMGGADSRQEIHATMSLEAIQERHARMMKLMSEAGPAEKGVVQMPALPAAASSTEERAEGIPTPPMDRAGQEQDAPEKKPRTGGD
jgi:hypothetical protein